MNYEKQGSELCLRYSIKSVERGRKHSDQTATVGGANTKKYQSVFIKIMHTDVPEKKMVKWKMASNITNL